jgi:hypothetical protein
MREKLSSIIARWVRMEPQMALENYTGLAKEIISVEGLDNSWEWVRQEIGRYVKLPHIKKELQALVAEIQTDEPAQTKRQINSGERLSFDDDDTDLDDVDILEDAYQRKFLVTNDGHYVIDVKKKKMRFSIEFIDKLFLYYSMHGYDYSGTKVINEFDLTPITWFAIKGAFRLFKHSHVFSPYTWEMTPLDEREEVAGKAIDKVMSSGKVTERVYGKKLQSTYKKAINKSHLIQANHNAFLEELADLLPQMQRVPITLFTPPNIIMQREEIMAAVTDLHAGAFITGLKGMPEYTTEILRKRLREFADYINSFNARRVKLGFLGDYLESFTGLNHDNSWQGMESGAYGARAVTLSFEIILEFIEQVHNVVEVDAVGGNHDRSTPSAKMDSKAEIAGILFSFLDRTLKNAGIKVVYDNDTVATTIGSSLRPILQHGHNGNARGHVGNTLWEHGVKDLFNFILQGHLHSRIIKNNDDGPNYRRIICPSIFTGNDYSKKAGFAPSLAGGIVIEETQKRLPLVHDIALY